MIIIQPTEETDAMVVGSRAELESLRDLIEDALVLGVSVMGEYVGHDGGKFTLIVTPPLAGKAG